MDVLFKELDLDSSGDIDVNEFAKWYLISKSNNGLLSNSKLGHTYRCGHTCMCNACAPSHMYGYMNIQACNVLLYRPGDANGKSNSQHDWQ